MSTFQYIAMDKAGKEIRGKIEAGSLLPNHKFVFRGESELRGEIIVRLPVVEHPGYQSPGRPPFLWRSKILSRG